MFRSGDIIVSKNDLRNYNKVVAYIIDRVRPNGTVDLNIYGYTVDAVNISLSPRQSDKSQYSNLALNENEWFFLKKNESKPRLPNFL